MRAGAALAAGYPLDPYQRLGIIKVQAGDCALAAIAGIYRNVGSSTLRNQPACTNSNNTMAQRRMFSLRIVNSARFLKMPNEAQVLYFHLCLNADDDGVVEAYPVMRRVGVPDDNFKVLVAKGFIVPLNDDEVTYILDWNEHNSIRADRKVNSIYKNLLVQVVPDIKLVEPSKRADTGKPTGQPMDNQWTPQVRLGKVRLHNPAAEAVDNPGASPETIKQIDEVRKQLKSKGIL